MTGSLRIIYQWSFVKFLNYSVYIFLNFIWIKIWNISIFCSLCYKFLPSGFVNEFISSSLSGEAPSNQNLRKLSSSKSQMTFAPWAMAKRYPTFFLPKLCHGRESTNSLPKFFCPSLDKKIMLEPSVVSKMYSWKYNIVKFWHDTILT